MNFSEKNSKGGFTFIELMVTVGLIALISLFVILTLNPAELRLQSRDARRVTDLNTINKAASIYYSDAINTPSTLFMGNASTTYISIFDPVATTTAGDQCQGLSLPSLPTGWSYHCAASSTYQRVDGTGWVPINFDSFSGGKFISNLPVDPSNQTSTGLYYTYTTNGNSYELTSIMESTKYRSKYTVNSPAPMFPGINALGTDLTLSALWSPSNLLDYWNFEEGKTTTTVDQLMNGNVSTLTCYNAGCVNPTWTGGKVGNYGLQFTGTNGTSGVPGSTVLVTKSGQTTFSQLTISAWIYPTAVANSNQMFIGDLSGSANYFRISGSKLFLSLSVNVVGQSSLGGTKTLSNNTWYLATVVFDGINKTLYLNGQKDATGVVSTTPQTVNWGVGQLNIGTWLNASNVWPFNGMIDDVRIYNDALSDSEIQALYNAQK